MAAFGTEDFIIDGSKKDIVSSHKAKIERLFNVMITFENVAADENGQKQWLVVSGAKSDRRSAKNYILALCCPEETSTLLCEDDELNANILESIEQKTSAVIQIVSSCQLKLGGTALACTLALSRLEEFHKITIVDAGEAQDVGQDMIDGCASGLGLVEMKTRTPNNERRLSAAQRLDVSLQKKLLQVGDSSGATEYLKTPDTVKRAILEGLIEYEEDGSDDIIDDEQLFGSDHFKGHDASKIIKPVGVVSPTSVKTVSGSSQVFDRCLPKQVDVDSPDYSEMKNSLCSMGAADVKADDTLRKQALQMGYALDIIEEALVDFECTKNPSLFDFLSVLEAVKIKKQNKSSSKAALLNESKTSLPAESEGTLGHRMTAVARKGKTKPVPGGTGASKRAHVGEGKAKNSAGTSGGSQESSHLDSCSSIIVIEDSDADDSICIVDAFPMKHSSHSDNIGGLPAEERQKMLLQQQSLKHKYQNQLSAGSSNSRPGIQTHTVSSNKKRHKKKVSLDTETVPRNRPEGWKKSSQESFSSVVTDKSWRIPQQASGSYYSDQQRHEMAGAIQKEYTDDKEQTCVLRLYKNDTSKPDRPYIPDNQLRFIVIDGSNIAMSHGNDKVFSCKGIKLCVNYFVARGHKQITAFVPEWRKYRNQQGNPQVIDIEILESLKDKGYLVFTPCRRLPGRWIASHDDRYILNLAVEEDAVVVSNDQYREFVYEKATYKHIIENRLLPYSFVKDHFMPPDDPLGRNGPTLVEFLRKTPWKSTPMQLSKKVPVIASVAPQQPQHSPVRRQQPVLPTVPGSISLSEEKKRPPDVTESLFMALKQVFPNEDQDYKIRAVLDNHETETDLNRLTNYCMSALFL